MITTDEMLNEMLVSKVDYKDLKKEDVLRTTQLGEPVTSILMESVKQGRGLKPTILVDTKGSEVGMFDEVGSVYADDVSQVKKDGEWLEVINKPQTGKRVQDKFFAGEEIDE